MSAAKSKRQWRCDNCGEPPASGEFYCQKCMDLGECDICDEYTFGADHSWHCSYCNHAPSDADPRSDSEPTLHESCIGEEERMAQLHRESEQRQKEGAEERRRIWPPCAMAGDGGCGVPGPGDWEADIAWCPQDGEKYLGREGSRYLCRKHDEEVHREERAAAAEAQRIWDALPKELYCSTCETVVDPGDMDDESWYECGECGDEFNRDGSADGDSNRCPSCTKFAAKSETQHCGECQEELEVRAVEEQLSTGTHLTAVEVHTEASPIVTADEAHAIGEALAAGVDHVWSLLERAQAGRVWEPLGLPDLPAFVAHYVAAEERRPLVAELHSEGMSTRAIAAATGVSQRTVVKDIQKAEGDQVSTGTHVTSPAKVKGKDGKSYPAKKKAPAKPKPAPVEEIEELPDGTDVFPTSYDILPVGTRVIWQKATLHKDDTWSYKDVPATIEWSCELGTGLTRIKPDRPSMKATETHVTTLTVVEPKAPVEHDEDEWGFYATVAANHGITPKEAYEIHQECLAADSERYSQRMRELRDDAFETTGTSPPVAL